jgi:hypothetical protein
MPVFPFADRGASDEWLYFVASGIATQASGGSCPGCQAPFSVLLMFDFHLPAPEAASLAAVAPLPGSTDEARQRLIDVRMAVALGGSSPVSIAAGDVLLGSAAPVSVETTAGGGFVAQVGSAMQFLAQDAVTLDGLRVTGVDAASGARFSVNTTRTIPSFVLHGKDGQGVLGAPATGNGYCYYSAPRYQVGGSFETGNGDEWEINEAFGWYDHQWGTIALPDTAAGKEAQALYVLAGGKVPLVDRGFGIVGVEVWFALQFLSALPQNVSSQMAGAVITGNCVFLDRPANLSGLAFNGRVTFENGSSLAISDGLVTVLATTQCPTGSGCDPVHPDSSQAVYGLVFSMDFPSLGLAHVVSTSVNGDHRMRFATGQEFWEGGSMLTVGGTSVGYGFVEQIGWDPSGTSDILSTAGVASPPASLVTDADTKYNYDTA